MTTDDPFDLDRFVAAQAPVFDAVMGELDAGQKRTHWMWFVFPQLRGLGQSPTAIHYGIVSLDEAEAYLAHPVLGPRLVRCTEAVLAVPHRSLHAIFGTPDDMKFRSSVTLFARAAAGRNPVFGRAVARAGGADARTLALLGAA